MKTSSKNVLEYFLAPLHAADFLQSPGVCSIAVTLVYTAHRRHLVI